MKRLILIVIGIANGVAFSQTPISKSYNVPTGKSISFKFDYPKLIQLETWDGDEVLVTGTVNINDGKNDDRFQLRESTEGEEFVLVGSVNPKEIPSRVKAIDGKDTLTFETKEEFTNYQKTHNRTFSTVNIGADMHIQLKIRVPRKLAARVESTYGLVELKGFDGNITVDAKYGGIDATIKTKSMGELSAQTSYGTIYSNLDVQFSSVEFKNFRHHIKTSLGNGPTNQFKSTYGNIYLRK